MDDIAPCLVIGAHANLLFLDRSFCLVILLGVVFLIISTPLYWSSLCLLCIQLDNGLL